MMDPNNILEAISNLDLTQQLRKGDAKAFEKLNLSFDQLYASTEEETGSLTVCNVSCALAFTGCFGLRNHGCRYRGSSINKTRTARGSTAGFTDFVPKIYLQSAVMPISEY